jgi:hypothetical protein
VNRREFLSIASKGAFVGSVAVTSPTLFSKVWKWITEQKEKIGGRVSYRFSYVVTLPPNRSNRIRFIDSVSKVD